MDARENLGSRNLPATEGMSSGLIPMTAFLLFLSGRFLLWPFHLSCHHSVLDVYTVFVFKESRGCKMVRDHR